MDSVYTGSTSANNEIYTRKAYLNAVQYSKQPEMQSTAEVKQQETASAPEETYQASSVEDNHQIYTAADGTQASKNYTLPDFHFDMDSQESIQRMEELRQSGLAKELSQVNKDLKAQQKELKTDGTQAEKAAVYSELQDVTSAIKGMELAHRAYKWDDIASTVDGEVSDVYKAYFVYSDVPAKEMKEVLQVTQDLQNPDSKMRLQGNDVTPLVRDQIWQTKMELLENAIQNPVNADGSPLEIDAEYYELASPEMIDKLTRASNSGAEVKVLMDPGQISGMSGNPDATSLAGRLNTLKRLEEGSDGKIAVQLFANIDVLGGSTEIMHRKLLRVGDEVVFGGMNANSGSGENVDCGMKIEGTAAERFTEIFQQDVELSRGKSADDIFGTHLDKLRNSDKDIVLTPKGVVDLMESQLPGGPVTGETYAERTARVIEQADAAGIHASDFVKIADSNKDGSVTLEDERKWLMGGSGEAVMTENGRTVLADSLEASVAKINSDENQAKLQDITKPNTECGGTETVAIGNTSVERQALVLHAIDSAQEYIKISAFVLNEDIARLLVEKKESMQEQGKDFNVQVVMDAGVYGYGGSPNEAAYQYLEDNGVEVKWAALDRSTEEHDRKIHAKMIITDQMMLAGSTNFSSRGLRDNWELSDIIFFNDENSATDQANVLADYEKLWNREAISIDTNAIAEKKYGDVEGAEGEYLRSSERTTATRKFLRGINNLEKEIGRNIDGLMATDPELAAQVDAKVAQGYADGYAILSSVGEEKLDEIRYNSKAWQTLQKIKDGTV
ncbi:MAG: hypothetical protein K6G50_01915 [bacterium]|nr:hypothetical protein [bacterium]